MNVSNCTNANDMLQDYIKDNIHHKTEICVSLHMLLEQMNYIGKHETPIQHVIELSNEYLRVLGKLYESDGIYLFPTIKSIGINKFLSKCTNGITCRHLRNWWTSRQYETWLACIYR